MGSKKKDKPFSCDLCPFSTGWRSNLASHKKSIHSNIRPFECRLCDYSAKMRVNLQAHERNIHFPHTLKLFKCPQCKKGYKVKSTLTRHLLRHGGVKRFSCELCPFKALTKAELQGHSRKHSGEKPFLCPHCNFASSSSNARQGHIKARHSSDRPFTCDLCDYKAAVRTALTNHRKYTHSADLCVKCELCDGIFKNELGLRNHNKSKHQNRTSERKTFMCGEPDCGKVFGTNSGLQYHMKVVHLEEKHSYSCSFCSFTAPYRAIVNAHTVTHTGEKPVKCDVCEKCFRSCYALKAHNARAHSNARPYSCDRCEYKGKTKLDLRSHYQRHERKYACSKCPYRGSTNVLLKDHLLTHRSGKQFECHLCKRKLQTHRTLKEHLRVTHSSSKPFKCNACPKAFKRKVTLGRHKVTHTDEKPFVCGLDGCLARFNFSDNRRRHVQAVHEKRARLQCTLCRKTFGRSDLLKQHIRAHATRKPYKCELCDYSAGYLRSLNTHLQTAHTNKSHLVGQNISTQKIPRATRISSNNILYPTVKLKFEIRENLLNHQENHARLEQSSPGFTKLTEADCTPCFVRLVKLKIKTC